MGVLFSCVKTLIVLLIDSWSSHKLKTVVISSLSAESLLWIEDLGNSYMIQKLNEEAFEATIDIELLADIINTANLMLDKRLRLDITAFREMV